VVDRKVRNHNWSSFWFWCSLWFLRGGRFCFRWWSFGI